MSYLDWFPTGHISQQQTSRLIAAGFLISKVYGWNLSPQNRNLNWIMIDILQHNYLGWGTHKVQSIYKMITFHNSTKTNGAIFHN